jgi:hypothetical protein
MFSAEGQNLFNSHVINRNEANKPNMLKTKYAKCFVAKRADINAMVFQNYNENVS